MAGGDPGCTVYDSVQEYRDRTTVERRGELPLLSVGL